MNFKVKQLIWLGLGGALIMLGGCQDQPGPLPVPTQMPIATLEPLPTATEPSGALTTVPTAVSPTRTLTAVPSETPLPTAEPTAAPPPPRQIESLADGRIRYLYGEEKFSIILPASWSVVDYLMMVDPATGGELARELAASELFVDMFANGGVRFYGVNTSEGSLASANPANVVVVRQSQISQDEFNELVAENISQIQADPAVIEGPMVTNGSAGEMNVRIDYAVETINPTGAGLTLELIQMHAFREGELVIVTATWDRKNGDAILPGINQIFESLELNP